MTTEQRSRIVPILFTDLVGSTALMQRLGDRQAQPLFKRHHDQLSDIILVSSGQLVEWTGDGVMASFSSTSDAVRCALAIQQTAQPEIDGERLLVRAGLNVGEILHHEAGSGLFGAALVIAKRLCDRAMPGQILCSASTADLLAGNRSFDFRRLGPLQLKGIAEPVFAAEVVYRPSPPDLNRRMLEQLLRALPDIIVACDELHNITFFNEGAERALGYSSAEILGHHVVKMYATPGHAMKVFATVVDSAQRTTASVSGLRTVLVTKARVELPVMATMSMLFDERGMIRASIGCGRPLSAT